MFETKSDSILHEGGPLKKLTLRVCWQAELCRYVLCSLMLWLRSFCLYCEKSYEMFDWNQKIFLSLNFSVKVHSFLKQFLQDLQLTKFECTYRWLIFKLTSSRNIPKFCYYQFLFKIVSIMLDGQQNAEKNCKRN